MPDLRQTTEYSNYMKALSWQVDQINNNYIYIKKFPILGNFIKIQRPNNLSQKFINKVIQKHKPFQLIIEPNLNQKINNFKITSPYLPSKTLILDLTQSEEKLLKAMHHKTRYNIKLAQKKGVAIKKTNNIHEFAAFWDQSRYGRSKIFFSQAKLIKTLYHSFGDNAHLVCGFHNNKLISGILMLTTKSTAYYMYAGSNKLGKMLHAPTLNTWESIRLGKKLKLKKYDFEGIYDDRFPIKTWQGFSRFKKSFGGHEVSYPGAFKK